MERQSLTFQLSRSQNACLGGVCAGLAEHFDLDPIVVRILAILIAAITLGLGALVYMVLWVVLPLGPPLAHLARLQGDRLLADGTRVAKPAHEFDPDGRLTLRCFSRASRIKRLRKR